MLPVSSGYRAALTRPHKRVHKVTAYTPDGTLLAGPVPVSGGDVRAQIGNRVTRSASFSTAAPFFPVSPTDPLSPAHAIARIESGIAYPDGTEELFPVFTGRIYAANLRADGSVLFRADDLAADVILADFEQPENSQAGSSTVREIQRLITDGFEWATFGTDDVTDAVVPRLTWDDDRGSALDDLASSVEGRWFTTGDGSFVVRRYAYTDTTPAVTLTDGVGGTLSAADITVTADGAYNSVVVLAERLDEGDPVRVVERVLDPSSPYVYGGLFGRRVLKIRMQTANGFPDAQRVARSKLEAVSALVRQWQINCVPDYSIEPGDVLGVSFRDVGDVQIADTVTYPLDTSALMSIRGRSTVDVS